MLHFTLTLKESALPTESATTNFRFAKWLWPFCSSSSSEAAPWFGELFTPVGFATKGKDDMVKVYDKYI